MIDIMKDVILDTLLDTLKIIPFLFVTFLIMEYAEHKFSNKSKKKIANAGKCGPVIGSFLGVIPQCGFSVMATNLYATRIISIGTLISIYLSTSDEMLPILLSEKVDISLIIKFLLVKIIIGMISGVIIDFVLRKKDNKNVSGIEDFCNEHNCDCSHGILKSSIKHTLNITLFLVVITFILNISFSYLGKETISKLFLKDNIFSPFISSLIGLIPNCGASVILTQLYLEKVISFASCISGLLTGSGVALLVLFKVNDNKKENIKILLALYLIGVLSGIVIETFSFIF